MGYFSHQYLPVTLLLLHSRLRKRFLAGLEYYNYGAGVSPGCLQCPAGVVQTGTETDAGINLLRHLGIVLKSEDIDFES